MPPQTNPIDSLHTRQTHNKPLFFLALVICLVVIVFLGWYGYDQEKHASNLEREAELLEEVSVVKADPTADWQTYRNEEYGFEFRYYEKDWTLDNMVSAMSQDYIVSLYSIEGKKRTEECQCGEYDRFVVQVELNNTKLSLTEYAEANFVSNYNLEETSIDGYKAIIFGERDRYVLVEKDNYVFTIDPVDQILSTFKFIATTTNATTN